MVYHDRQCWAALRMAPANVVLLHQSLVCSEKDDGGTYACTHCMQCADQGAGSGYTPVADGVVWLEGQQVEVTVPPRAVPEGRHGQEPPEDWMTRRGAQTPRGAVTPVAKALALVASGANAAVMEPAVSTGKEVWASAWSKGVLVIVLVVMAVLLCGCLLGVKVQQVQWSGVSIYIAGYRQAAEQARAEVIPVFEELRQVREANVALTSTLEAYIST